MKLQAINQTNNMQSCSFGKKAHKSSAGKVLASTGVVAGAIASSIVLARKGKLNPVEGGNKYIETAKALLKKPADFSSKMVTKAVNKYKIAAKGNYKLSSLVDRPASYIRHYQKVIPQKIANIKGGFTKFIDTMADKAESCFNRMKFN